MAKVIVVVAVASEIARMLVVAGITVVAIEESQSKTSLTILVSIMMIVK